MLTKAASAARRRVLGVLLSCFALLLSLLPLGALIPLAEASGVPFQSGDVFAGVGNGTIKHFSNTGVLLDTLLTGDHNVFDTGMAFDSANNLYGTNFDGNSVAKFDTSGNNLGNFGSGYNTDDESIVFDAAGNAYVGQADGTRHVLKFDSSGTLVATYSPATEDRGTDWIDLAADQCTLYYTSEGRLVKRFNVCTNTQLPDFASGLPGSFAYALRIRPNGEVLVADSSEVVRLSPTGTIIQTYTVPGSSGNLFALNLDPDGTSFWTGDLSTGVVARVDIASGAILTTFNAGALTALGGLAVFKEITVAKDNTPPTCVLAGVDKNASGQTTDIRIAVQDSDGGLATIAVTELANATANVGTYQTGISSTPTTVTITDHTTGVVTVQANKIDLSSGASIALTATDVAGNSVSCDPVSVSAVRADGKPVTQWVSGVQKADTKLTVVNDGSAVDNLSVSVNGHTFKVNGLKAGQKASVDISSALTAGTNQVSATLAGKPGSSATLLFGNI